MKNESLPVVLTGATGSIGREIARGLCEKGESLILACRNMEKAEAFAGELIEEYPGISVCCRHLDLESPENVRKFAAGLNGKISGVICNAGIMCRNYRTDRKGREMSMAVNFFNTVLLAQLLIPKIKDGGALVFTTSLTRFMIPGSRLVMDIDAEHFSQLGSYAVSKKAVTLAARELAGQYPPARLRINCADPGIVDTGMIRMGRWFDPLADIFFRPFIRKPRSGSVPAIRAYYAGGTGKIYCKKNIREN